MTQQPQLSIHTLVANDGAQGVIPINNSMNIRELQDAIAANITFELPSSELKKFVARNSNGTWIKITGKHLFQMSRHRIAPYELFQLMNEENTMSLNSSLSSYNIPDTGACILVRRPGPLYVEPTWRKDTPQPVATLDDNQLSFVNRNKAVRELQEIHYSGFACARAQSQGTGWKVPIVDTSFGVGKTEFSKRYIEQCKLSLQNGAFTDNPALRDRREFLKEELCTCHTLKFTAQPGQFVKQEDIAAVVNAELVNAIVPQLVPGTEPQFFSELSDKRCTRPFVDKLVECLGSVFIVIDDFDKGFSTTDGDDKSREHFLHFCGYVLTKWVKNPKVHFILLGHVPWLWTAAESMRKHSRMGGWECVRLQLSLLRPCELETILLNTNVSKVDERSLCERWQLSSEADVQKAARLLFQVTSGSPRLILRVLQAHNTFDALEEFVAREQPLELSDEEMKELGENVAVWQSTLVEWLGEDVRENAVVNLADPVPGFNGEEVSAMVVLDKSHLSWEGTVEKARIFAHRSIRDVVLNCQRPLIKFIAGLGKIPGGTLDFSGVFEKICLKRFAELLSSPQLLKDTVPELFNVVDTFYVNGEMVFEDSRSFPKITGREDNIDQRTQVKKAISKQTKTTAKKKKRSRNLAMKPKKSPLEFATATRDEWPVLMKDIFGGLRSSSDKCLCFKPARMSSSSDALFSPMWKLGRLTSVNS